MRSLTDYSDRLSDRQVAKTYALNAPSDPLFRLWFVEVFKYSLLNADRRPGSLMEFCDCNRCNQLSLRLIISIFRFFFFASIGFVLGNIYALSSAARRCLIGNKFDLKLACVLHPEDSTRTRHVLAAIAKSKAIPNAIIVLGRSWLSARQVKSALTLDRLAPNAKIIYPYDLTSIVFSLIRLCQLAWGGIYCYGNTIGRFDHRSIVAISFRVCMGNIALEWAKRSISSPRTHFLFGITGTADTVGLEMGISFSKSVSIHCVHGQATGLNFLSFSDFALFKSRYDAFYYNFVRCYKNCLFIESEQPAIRSCGFSGLILFSNLSHPSNLHYLSQGVEPEVRLLHEIAELAKLDPYSFAPLAWRPHPVVFDALPAVDRQKLLTVASRLGFEIHVDHVNIASTAKTYKWFIVTPSTIAIDALMSGVLPIVIDMQDAVLDSSLSCFPLASDMSELRGCIQAYQDRELYEQAYVKAWREIMPSTRFTLDKVLDICSAPVRSWC